MTDDIGRELVDWTVAAGLQSADEQELLDGFCARLNEVGFDLARAFIASQILHPLHAARGVVWSGQRAAREDYGFSPEEEADWQRSPLRHIIDNELPSLHIRLDDTLEPDRFPLLARLRAEGGTDYLAQRRGFGSGSSLQRFPRCRRLLDDTTAGRLHQRPDRRARPLHRAAGAGLQVDHHFRYQPHLDAHLSWP